MKLYHNKWANCLLMDSSVHNDSSQTAMGLIPQYDNAVAYLICYVRQALGPTVAFSAPTFFCFISTDCSWSIKTWFRNVAFWLWQEYCWVATGNNTLDQWQQYSEFFRHIFRDERNGPIYLQDNKHYRVTVHSYGWNYMYVYQNRCHRIDNKLGKRVYLYRHELIRNGFYMHKQDPSYPQQC